MTSTHVRRFAVAPALFTLVGLGACGGGSDAPAATVPTDADVVFTAVAGLVWEKNDYTATAENGSVVIAAKNDSADPHNLSVKDAGNLAVGDTLDIAKKGSVASDTYALTPGTYTVFCTIPGHTNMVATLTVD